jgi:hypothetical protein
MKKIQNSDQIETWQTTRKTKKKSRNNKKIKKKNRNLSSQEKKRMLTYNITWLKESRR